jgi:WD40 repeat protein
VWDAATGRELRSAQARTVWCVAISPDGKTVAAGGFSDEPRGTLAFLWDFTAAREPRQLEGLTKPVTSMAFSPDGRLVAAGNESGTVALWATATGERVRLLHGDQGRITCVRFSPDGKALAAAAVGKDGAICLWDVATAKPRATLRSPTGSFFGASCLDFSPDGQSWLRPSGGAK